MSTDDGGYDDVWRGVVLWCVVLWCGVLWCVVVCCVVLCCVVLCVHDGVRVYCDVRCCSCAVLCCVAVCCVVCVTCACLCVGIVV